MPAMFYGAIYLLSDIKISLRDKYWFNELFCDYYHTSNQAGKWWRISWDACWSYLVFSDLCNCVIYAAQHQPSLCDVISAFTSDRKYSVVSSYLLSPHQLTLIACCSSIVTALDHITPLLVNITDPRILILCQHVRDDYLIRTHMAYTVIKLLTSCVTGYASHLTARIWLFHQVTSWCHHISYL